MTTRRSQSTEQKHHQRFVLPDPPEREPEDMTSFDHLTLNGSAHHLVQHLGNPQTTLVAGERYITLEPGAPSADRMDPDLLVAFNADVQTYRDSNGYVISEQGKPPDFVMEIASRSTGQHDVVDKRPAYAALGIPEYWRFDQTGDFHETRLAGDRLVEDRYEPIPIETVEEGWLITSLYLSPTESTRTAPFSPRGRQRSLWAQVPCPTEAMTRRSLSSIQPRIS